MCVDICEGKFIELSNIQINRVDSQTPFFYYMTHGNYCQIFDISEINFVHYIFSQKNETLKGLFLFSKFREEI